MLYKYSFFIISYDEVLVDPEPSHTQFQSRAIQKCKSAKSDWIITSLDSLRHRSWQGFNGIFKKTVNQTEYVTNSSAIYHLAILKLCFFSQYRKKVKKVFLWIFSYGSHHLSSLWVNDRELINASGSSSTQSSHMHTILVDLTDRCSVKS